MTKTGPKPGDTRLEMGAARKDAYLVALRASGGNRTAAAAAVAPHSRATGASKPGYSSIRSAAERDSEFAARIEEVLEQVRDDVYALIWKLATEGTKDFVYQGKEQIFNKDGSVATVHKYDVKLLLRLAAKLDPAWRERRDVEHSGEIVHRAGMSMSDIRALSPAEREQVEQAFTLLQGVRDGASESKAIEHKGELLDVSFEEIEDENTMAVLEAIEQRESE